MSPLIYTRSLIKSKLAFEEPKKIEHKPPRI
jgi:hypothetical protein